MTDNFSNNLQQQRIFRAERAPELNADYRRPPLIENQFAECLNFSKDELAARIKIKDSRSGKYLRAETLIALLAQARAENLPEIEDLICPRLARIVENLIRNFLWAKNLSENFIEEAVGEIIGEFFGQILERRQQSYNFWEVNFYVSLQRLTKVYLRKNEPKARITDTFSELTSAENDGLAFEDNLMKYENLTVQKKLEIKQIVGKMPNEHRLIFICYYIGEWTQEQIAQTIGVTDRTVRARLKAINVFLNDFRASGGEK